MSYASEPWYCDDQGKPIVFPEATNYATVTITLTHYQFQCIVDCASRGCRNWAYGIDIDRDGFRITWHIPVLADQHCEDERFQIKSSHIRPDRIAGCITRIVSGHDYNNLELPAAEAIRNLWLAPEPDTSLIDDEMANNLVQLVCFDEIRYG